MAAPYQAHFAFMLSNAYMVMGMWGLNSNAMGTRQPKRQHSYKGTGIYSNSTSSLSLHWVPTSRDLWSIAIVTMWQWCQHSIQAVQGFPQLTGYSAAYFSFLPNPTPVFQPSIIRVQRFKISPVFSFSDHSLCCFATYFKPWSTKLSSPISQG